MKNYKKIMIALFSMSILLFFTFTSICSSSFIFNNNTIKIKVEEYPIILNDPSFAYCIMLKLIFLSITFIYFYFELRENEILCQLLFEFAFTLFNYGKEIGCWDNPPPSFFNSELNLKQKQSDYLLLKINLLEKINICSC
jgi:hypothetical protein